MINVILCGISGKMGRVMSELIADSDDCQVVAGVDVTPPTGLNIPYYRNLSDVCQDADVLIDFSRPDALGAILPYITQKKIAAVLATTGYTAADIAAIDEASKFVPIFRSANMSLGVNLQIDLAGQAAALLSDMADIEIIEKHHSRKADAPSGTALMLAESINSALEHKKHFIFGRHTTSGKRENSEIGIHAVRGGSIVGEHDVLFIGEHEVITITHRAENREVFAAGALSAARFLVAKTAGLYSMRDIISETRDVTSLKIVSEQAVIIIEKDDADLAKIFCLVADAGIVVDIITKNLNSVAFSIAQSDASSVLDLLSGYNPVAVVDLCKLTVEGIGMEYGFGVAAKLFAALGDIELPIITTSETKISFCVAKSDSKLAAKAVHQAFELRE